jgi:hypothetical protein
MTSPAKKNENVIQKESSPEERKGPLKSLVEQSNFENDGGFIAGELVNDELQ